MFFTFTPFIAEEIYQKLPNHKKSIMLEQYPTIETKHISKKHIYIIIFLKKIIKDIRNFRLKNKINFKNKIIIYIIFNKKNKIILN